MVWKTKSMALTSARFLERVSCCSARGGKSRRERECVKEENVIANPFLREKHYSVHEDGSPSTTHKALPPHVTILETKFQQESWWGQTISNHSINGAKGSQHLWASVSFS